MTQRQRRRQRRTSRRAPAILIALGTVVIALGVGAAAFASWVVTVADDASLRDLREIRQPRNSVVFAADGSRLGFIQSDEARTPVPLKRIPAHLKYATVAIEDERFFEHEGVDAEGVVRAGVENIDAGQIVQGGSTITMQLMRNLYIADPEVELKRKIIEARLALQYEERHSKQFILGKYLNTASYGTIQGRTAIGVQAASKTYFSKPVWKLTLEQAALLAGLPQAPSLYNPLLNPRAAKERRNEVLQKMAQLGYITQERATQGYQAGLQLRPSDVYTRIREPYFFDYVEQKLLEEYGVNTVRKGGLRVYTTIDPDLQEAGRDAIDGQLPYSTDPAAAVVAIDPETGEIKAMASSSSYKHDQYNLAAQGHRQPGSAAKTFVLAAAIKNGINPSSTYYESKPLELDLPEYGHWSVATYGETYSGTMDLVSATLASDNTVYAQLILDLGPEKVAEMAKALGITTPLDGYPAEGLGGVRLGFSPLEMANAYATLAAGGVRRSPIAIRRVEFPSGRVDRPEPRSETRVMPEWAAYEVTKILNQNVFGGTGTAAYTGCSSQSGKTGTTDNFNDAWFVGYQPNLATAVWVGYPDALREMTSVHGISVAGGTFPAQIWHDFYVNGAIPCEYFDPPDEAPQWTSFYGSYTASSSSSSYDSDDDSSYDSDSDSADSDETSSDGDTDGYDDDLYAPGAGQEAAPAPQPSQPASPPQSAAPPPSVSPGQPSGGVTTGGSG